MASDTLAGLDALDLQVTPRDRGRIASRAWSATWPRLLAIALVIVVWELIHRTGWKRYVFPGPGTTLGNLWEHWTTPRRC